MGTLYTLSRETTIHGLGPSWRSAWRLSSARRLLKKKIGSVLSDVNLLLSTPGQAPVTNGNPALLKGSAFVPGRKSITHFMEKAGGCDLCKNASTVPGAKLLTAAGHNVLGFFNEMFFYDSPTNTLLKTAEVFHVLRPI